MTSADRFSNSDLWTQQFQFKFIVGTRGVISGANLALDLHKFSPEDARAKLQQDKLAQTKTALDAHVVLQGFLLLPS